MRQRIELDAEQLKHYEDNVIDYKEFKKINREQQIYLIEYYYEKIGVNELAEYWNKPPAALYNIKAYIKDEIKKQKDKALKAQQKKVKKETVKNEAPVNENVDSVPETTEVVPDQMNEVAPVVHQPTEYIQHAPIQSSPLPTEYEGISFTIAGKLYSPDEIEKKLKKAIALVQDEDNQFFLRVQLIECTDDNQDCDKDKFDSKEIKALKNELDQVKNSYEKLFKASQGYGSMSTDTQGLHHPQSEYEHEQQNVYNYTSTSQRHQAFYICPKCRDKRKVRIPQTQGFINCKSCGNRMKTNPATDKGFPNVDEFGNVFIAGDFTRSYSATM